MICFFSEFPSMDRSLGGLGNCLGTLKNLLISVWCWNLNRVALRRNIARKATDATRSVCSSHLQLVRDIMSILPTFIDGTTTRCITNSFVFASFNPSVWIFLELTNLCNISQCFPTCMMLQSLIMGLEAITLKSWKVPMKVEMHRFQVKHLPSMLSPKSFQDP